MLFYRAALPLSSRTLTFAAGIIRRHRASIGSGWRKLSPGKQALLVLVYLRKGETFADVAAGFGVGTATAWRYVNETVALLAARGPETPQGGPGRDEGRARLRRRGRHLDPGRPGCRGPALLFGKAPKARNEPAGHRQSGRGRPRQRKGPGIHRMVLAESIAGYINSRTCGIQSKNSEAMPRAARFMFKAAHPG